MTVNEIRNRFLRFFEAKGHTLFPSDSLVPQSDPTLLFTGAGMNQFKEYFLGNTKGIRRAVSCQKCLRTGDLDEVGQTAYHHTFFEMLGNFSFGDYFKKEAIAFAWEFLTGELGLSPTSLAVSVYKEDQEAYEIWAKGIKIPKERIFKFGPKENFWPSNVQKDGPNGPCGPCSEIFFDREPEKPFQGYDEKRFFEVWNLVFTQFERLEDGSLKDLPAKNIDTGMGLERVASVMQRVGSNFEIDGFRGIVSFIEQNVKKSAVEKEFQRAWVNRIADHARAVSFVTLDGVIPSNKERGYMLRTLIRRASFSARTLGIETPFLFKVVPHVAEAMREPYPDLWESRERIAQVVFREEESFEKTLEQGLSTEEKLLEEHLRSKKKILSGKNIFYLYDTLGLPLDLIRYAAENKKISLDEEGFKEELEKQRERSKKGSQMKGDIFGEDVRKKMQLDLKTEFKGYETCRIDRAFVATILKDGERVEEAREGDPVEVFLKESPFYGEQGGQIGDTGYLESKTARVRVEDAQHLGETLVHRGKVEKGRLRSGEWVTAVVDEARRRDIMKNHTATHLLHSALREILGPHATQAGSWVGPDRLRFDFMHPKALSSEEIRKIEERVNEHILRKDPVRPVEMTREDSRKEGAIAFFGEKYGDKVRVLKISDYSKELCGGTHVSSTAEIKIFLIISESSIGSGIRRIEAVTGSEAEKRVKRNKELIGQIALSLNIPSQSSMEEMETKVYQEAASDQGLLNAIALSLRTSEEKILVTIENLKNKLEQLEQELSKYKVIEKKKEIKNTPEALKEKMVAWVGHLQNRLKEEEQELLKFKKGDLEEKVEAIIGSSKNIGSVHFIYYDVGNSYSKEEVPLFLDLFRQKLRDKWVAAVGGVDEEEKLFYVAGTDGSISAKEISSILNRETGSQGGGSDRLAKGGGGDPEKVSRAIDVLEKWIKERRI